MFKTGDFKVCLSSVEFSIFYQQLTPKCCPSCGYFFPPENLSEVASRYFRESYFRLSSLILVLGVGSWLCYKMIIKRKSKMKPKKPMPCSTLTLQDQMIINKMDKLLNYRSSSKKVSAAAAAAAAAAAVYSNLNHRSNHLIKETINLDSCDLPMPEEVSYTVSYTDSEVEDVDDQEDVDYYSNDTEILSKALDQYSTMKRSHSISSQSGEIGEGTIAKLDQLLHQIEDIKESVGEMNSDLFTVHSYDHNRLLKSSDYVDDDEDENLLNRQSQSEEDTQNPSSLEFLGDKEEPQTPSLEWDSNDISLFSELNGGYQSAETESTTTSSHLMKSSTAIKQIASSTSLSNQSTSLSSTVFTNNTINSSNLPKAFGRRSPVISESINSLPSSTSYRNLNNLDTSFTNCIEGTMSTSGVTSIDGSLLSSPDQERTRLESIHDLIKEARRLGLLNDLVKFLLKNANRDSAYFEE